jgi:hypothetical protein
MDILQGFSSRLIHCLRAFTDPCSLEYLPQAAQFYNEYYYPYRTYLAPIYRNLLLASSYFYRYIYPTLYPIYRLSNNALQSLSSDSPDVVTLLILAGLLIASLKVLDYMRKTIVYWIGLAIKMVLWVTVAAVGFYVYYRGIEQSMEDFGWVWGFLQGLGEEGQRVGGRKANYRERDARRMAGKRGRTRGAW